MADTGKILSGGLEVPNFRRKPDIPCPASGLVINPDVGCVHVWTPENAHHSDILEGFDPRTHWQANQTLTDELRQQGAATAAKYLGAPPAAQPNPVVTSPPLAPPIPSYVHAAFQALDVTF